MFNDFINLRPLKGVAEILANDDTWGQLYDLDQLAKNTVKVNAATYVNHLPISPIATKPLHYLSGTTMTCAHTVIPKACYWLWSIYRFVDFNLAQDTASKVGNVEQYITNQFFHNGILVDPKDIMKHLFKISKRVRE
jgi:hypothetical protein